MKIFVENNPLFLNIVKYTLALLFENKNLPYSFTNEAKEADLSISQDDNSDLFLNLGFYKKIEDLKFSYDDHFSEGYFINDNNGNCDLLATIFYLVNCLQEYSYPETKLDHYHRFPFEVSLQHKLGIIDRNIVQEIIDDLFFTHSKLSKLKTKRIKTKYHLSHDIDYIFDPAKKEINWALKNLKPILLFKFLFAYLLKKSIWFPYKEILKLHKKFNLESRYFFISNNGKGPSGIKNGDYKFKSETIQNAISFLKDNGQSIGLHKSTFPESINEEAQKFKSPIKDNRNHYLKFVLPHFWDELEASKIQNDYSLGFGSKMGFRNSYGKSFKPFNFKTGKAYRFTVYPLHIMDSTFMYYTNLTPSQSQEKILDFIDKHQYNCDLSIVWHNTSFTPYSFSRYLSLYKNMMKKITDLKIN